MIAQDMLPATPFQIRRHLQIEGECWTWVAFRNPQGYGKVTNRGFPSQLVHRAVYIFERGAIDPGMTLDHLCQNKACARPDHLEVVTSAENTRRRDEANDTGFYKTHCSKGHPFDPENTGWGVSVRGRAHRICKACKANIQKRYRRQKEGTK